jgi:protein transport protein DSL1/ZW10
LGKGIGSTKEVERTETQIVTEVVGEQPPGPLTANPESKEREHDWDAEWSDDEGKGNEDSALGEVDKGKAKERSCSGGSDSEGNSPKEESNWTAGVLKEAVNDDDDVADAWGWGDEDEGEAAEKTEEKPASIPEETETLEPQAKMEVQREVTLTEKYTVSSMPDPVFNAIKQIIEDGVTLTREE